ncbi:hypothetical protein BDW02DRAFT_590255 [Decorospora gaudefroyi]|uniref:Uncharacterized protein n=1 Tax=Decorospora gaudefroyi TaxID=184978 RepID=A0A6A5K7P9_9PLEO|nr:hypothetical protein BDW02DRAFT_590255 [Decorospora gaudefroyi]
MCDSTFAFGQRGSHFFQCPSRREHTHIPWKLDKFLSSAQLKLVHHVALGFEDSFLLAWRDNTGIDRVEWSGLPSELVEFLHNRNRDIRNLRCVLGPYNSSFFVHDNASYLWKNLPEKLLSGLKANIQDGNWIDRPRIVALGAGNNFLLVTEKNAVLWDLRNYEALSKLIQQRHVSELHGIDLHPYRFQAFVAQYTSGKLTYENIPPHQLAGMQAMVGPVLQDTKDLLQKPLTQRESDRRESMQRRPSALQRRAQLRREWNEHSQEITAQAKGVKLSFSLNVSLGGIAGMLG